MVTVSYSGLRSQLKHYCDLAAEQEETIIVTRAHGKDVVMISLEQYDNITRWSRDAAYFMKLESLSKSLEESNKND